jgi:hypothetical protein
MGQAMRKVNLINRKRDIMRQLSDLAREGWKAAKPFDYIPLEAELREINKRLYPTIRP